MIRHGSTAASDDCKCWRTRRRSETSRYAVLVALPRNDQKRLNRPVQGSSDDGVETDETMIRFSSGRAANGKIEVGHGNAGQRNMVQRRFAPCRSWRRFPE